MSSVSESDWLTNNRRGFDADKFCKFVAMFDSNYIEEANAVFLDFVQLKRSQLY